MNLFDEFQNIPKHFLYFYLIVYFSSLSAPSKCTAIDFMPWHLSKFSNLDSLSRCRAKYTLTPRYTDARLRDRIMGLCQSHSF